MASEDAIRISLTVNERAHRFEVEPGESLLDLLRDRLFLTGVKQGCAVGECGACTVLVDGVPVNSCIYLAVWADGRSVATIEGVARGGELSPVQDAFVQEGAIQCGFCTPGLVMTTTALRNSGKALTDEEIRREISGHLCRCTGYQNIKAAVRKSLKST
jgi:aerobic-type carbon monoxide dehydrogenase small subunit (CoxS/CutS family)